MLLWWPMIAFALINKRNGDSHTVNLGSFSNEAEAKTELKSLREEPGFGSVKMRLHFPTQSEIEEFNRLWNTCRKVWPES